MPVLYFSHPACRLHETGPDHPERAARLSAIDDQLIAAGIEPWLIHRTAPAATRAQLERVHAPHYLDALERKTADCEDLCWLDADTALAPHSLEAARHAAGAVVAAVDAVCQGALRRAFCAVRPPGHHASSARAMGFCLYNNVAVGAAHALAEYGFERVAICDFDVHHGNGTEAIFLDRPQVFMVSAFEQGLWPASEPSLSAPANARWLPLPPGTRGARYRQRFEAELLSAMADFEPQLLLVSAGFDGHREDAISRFYLDDADYGWITRRLAALADRCCEGRLVSVLEGGYALPALGRSVAMHLSALME